MFLGPVGLGLFGETGGKVGLPKCKHAECRLLCHSPGGDSRDEHLQCFSELTAF